MAEELRSEKRSIACFEQAFRGSGWEPIRNGNGPARGRLRAGEKEDAKGEGEMTRNLGIVVALVCTVLGTSTVSGLTTGTDVIVPAAGRGAGVGTSMWITDVNVLNTGDQTASVQIFWLTRNQVNASPRIGG